MNTDIVLAVVIIAQGLLLFLMDRNHARQIDHFSKALIAKNLRELSHAEAEEKIDPKKTSPVVEEFDPITADTPETFDAMIAEQLNKAQES